MNKKTILSLSIMIVTSLFSILNLFGQSNVIPPEKSIYDIKINASNGDVLDLSMFKGKHILFVNVASECGFTGQYEDLEKLYQTNIDKLVIIGVPCNQFGGQEPGSNEQIQSFCQLNYGVTFPLTDKVEVKGDDKHPLYQWLTQKELNENSSSTVKWNFQKYLVSPEGNLVDYYYSITKPLSKKITKHFVEK